MHYNGFLRPLILFLKQKLTANQKGALLIVAAGLLTTLSTSLAHSLSQPYSAFQVLSFKCFFALLAFIGVLRRQIFSAFSSEQRWTHFLKACCGALGNYFWLWGVMLFPLAHMASLSLTSAFFTSVGAWLFFAEKPGVKTVFCLIIGAVGALLVIRPVSPSLSFLSLLPLASALFFSVSSLLVKKLTKKDSAETTLLYLLFFMLLLSLPFSVKNWQTPSTPDLYKLCALGVIYSMVQLFIIKAYAIAKAAYIAPFKFFRLPQNIVVGFVFFAEVPPLLAVFGALLILLANCLMLTHKKKLMLLF